MIATVLSGGIGNQLFMYATARAMALRNRTGLIINDSVDFAKDRVYHRNYELSAFNVSFKKDRFLTFDFPGGLFFKKLSRRAGRNVLFPSYKYIYDEYNNREFNPSVLRSRSASAFLEGYWHSELYFKDFEDEIRKDLVFNFQKSDLLDEEERRIFEDLDHTPICVGVRRYEEAPNSEYFNLVDKDYYITAMDYISSMISTPVFYVFTQAKEWVKKNLCDSKYDIRFICDKVGNAAVEDLYLMSKFKYHIVSNSSYYWWGAWLAKGDVVVTCRNWFNRQAICEKWIVV